MHGPGDITCCEGVCENSVTGEDHLFLEDEGCCGQCTERRKVGSDKFSTLSPQCGRSGNSLKRSNQAPSDSLYSSSPRSKSRKRLGHVDKKKMTRTSN